MLKHLARFSRCGLALAVAALLARPAIGGDRPPTSLQVRHAAGQTFITWQEADSPIKDGSISMADLHKARQELQRGPKIRYRVYRSTQPITSLENLRPIAEVTPMSAWNFDLYGGEARADQKAFRYVIEEGKAPLPPGAGLCVCNPEKAGDGYYAVTGAVDGKENRSLGQGNVSRQAVRETVGQGVPVLQRTETRKEFQYVSGNPTLDFYVRWESPPNCAVEGRPFDYLVAIPPKPAKPAPVGIHLHCWGGSLMGGYGWWYNAEKGSILLASNQIPYDWWTGYHESYWKGPRDKRAWQDGVVRPYSTRRMISFLDWMKTKYDVDPARTHVAGSSMGGSGAPMFAIRYPERIAWAVAWVGVHTPSQSPGFKGSYANVYGEPEWQVKFEDGTPVWDYYNDAWYLRKHPEKEIGLITFSNGKNDAGIGWPQAVEFYRALQETKRPHLFVWGQSGHGQRATMPVTLEERVLPIDVRVDQTLPAFAHCSLDDLPGTGDPKDGDPKGQVNMYLCWETADIVDRADRWAMTVGLIAKAPADEATVDITPRRCQQFKLPPGSRVKWTNTAGGKVVETGEAKADAIGLVTLEKVRVGKGKNRIEIVAASR